MAFITYSNRPQPLRQPPSTCVRFMYITEHTQSAQEPRRGGRGVRNFPQFRNLSRFPTIFLNSPLQPPPPPLPRTQAEPAAPCSAPATRHGHGSRHSQGRRRSPLRDLVGPGSGERGVFCERTSPLEGQAHLFWQEGCGPPCPRPVSIARCTPGVPHTRTALLHGAGTHVGGYWTDMQMHTYTPPVHANNFGDTHTRVTQMKKNWGALDTHTRSSGDTHAKKDWQVLPSHSSTGRQKPSQCPGPPRMP